MKYGSSQGELIAREDDFAKRLRGMLTSGENASIASLFDDARTGGLACRILELAGELRAEENDIHRAARSYLRGCLSYRHSPSENANPSVREVVDELRSLLLTNPQ